MAVSNLSNNGNGNSNNANNGGGITPTPIQNIGSKLRDQHNVPYVLTDMVRRAKKQPYPTALHRDDVLMKMYRILLSKHKPSMVLVGDSGIGKSAIVYEFVNRLAKSDPLITQLLGNLKVYELQLQSLVSGKSIMGEMEETIDDVINFVTSDPNIVLFVDDISSLLSSDNQRSTTSTIASSFARPLSSGSIRLIGTATLQTARELHTNPALQRQFEKVPVTELTFDQTLDVLHDIRRKYTKLFPNIVVNDDMLEYIATTANLKVSTTVRPDNAITLYDLAITDLTVERTNQLIQNPQLATFGNSMVHQVKASHVQNSLNKLYTMPNTTAIDSSIEVERQLRQNIKGQDHAIDEVISVVKRMQLELLPRTKPISLLLGGLTGTGKTETGKQLASVLFGSTDNMIYLDMTSYSNKSSINRIIGAEDGYVGSSSKRPLIFESLETNPYQVIVLDEFEKADVEVQRLFMQVLDEGRLETARGVTINFKNAIVIATTNAGVQELAKNSIGFAESSTDLANVSRERIMEALSKDFPIELLNRFEHVIGYRAVDRNVYAEILCLKYNKLIAQIMESNRRYNLTPTNINTETPPNFLEHLIETSYNPQLNGRPAERTVREFIENMVLESNGSLVVDIEQNYDNKQAPTQTQATALVAPPAVEFSVDTND